MNEKARMPITSVVIFVCEHGAAKSILAAAYFNQLANQRGLNVTAVARGTNPDRELSEPTVRGLSKDGLTPAESTPQKLSLEALQTGQRIVSFCELPKGFEEKAVIERWEGIPAVSENYEQARNVIIERLKSYLDHLRL